MKKNLRMMLSSCAVVGACAMVFMASSNLVVANITGQTQDIPTEYSAVSSKPVDRDLTQGQENYTKPSYTVTEMSYPTKSEQRLPNALSMEDAAEIGAQYIGDMTGLDLDGMRFEMMYETNGRTKPCWSGFVIGKNEDFVAVLNIDAVTGERISLDHMNSAQDLRNSGNANITNIINDQKELEDSYRNNCDEHIKAAKLYGEKHFNARIVDAKFSLVYQISDGAELAELLKDIEEPEARGEIIDEYHSVDRPTQVLIKISITDENGKEGYVSVFDNADKTFYNVGTTNPDPYLPFDDAGGLG